jgi:BirA family transcriptional regulator, biotin operon repressor / biotin---[acetyl-CoA-carboxylase] ligase
MTSPDRLSAGKLRAGLKDALIGREIVVLDETTSTNDCIWQMAQDGSAEGAVVFAEYQTAGRGQRGNNWESAAYQGLWFSILLRPGIDVRDSEKLTSWAARMVATTIEEEIPVKATIKLPNDVYVGDRKVAGVLVEMRAQEKAPHLAILGIGVNLNQKLDDFSDELQARATSLALLVDGPVDRNRFAVALLQNLDRSYRELFQ